MAQQELMKERGVNPLAGCLPLLLQLPLLFIMYSVIQQRPDERRPDRDAHRRSASQVVDLQCTNINPATGMPDAALGPCIDSVVPILGDIAIPQTFLSDRAGSGSASWPSSRPRSSSSSRG